MHAFRLIRRWSLNSGTYFDAFGARAVPSERTVLLKRLHASRPGVAEALHGALKAWRACGLQVPELFKQGEAAWWGTEATEGESLRWVMGTLAKKKGFLAPAEGIGLLAKVARSLDSLHQSTLFHGDVCPSNVFITETGEVLLHDVGVAHSLGSAGDAGPFRAEANYLSPEQLRQQTSGASDVFRLGLWLYELSHGRPLWVAGAPGQLTQAAAQFPGLSREALKHVPEPYQSLLVAMLDPSPEKRPGASAVHRALQDAIARNKWSTAPADVAQLFARVAPERAPLFTSQAPGEPLQLTPLGASAGTPPAMPALTPPTGAVFAKIATRKMTREELVVARTGLTAPGVEALPADVRAAMALVHKGLVTRQRFEAAQAAAVDGLSLTTALVDQGADEDTVVQALSELTRTPSVARKRVVAPTPGAEALAMIPLEVSQRARALPLGLKGNQLMVAMVDPLDEAALALLREAARGQSLLTFRAGERALAEGRAHLYPDATVLELERGPSYRSFDADEVTAPALDAVALISGAPRAPGEPEAPAPPRDDVHGRTCELLLKLAGARGAQGASLIDVAVQVATHAQLPAVEVEQVRSAASAMVAAALAANRPPWDVPRPVEFQDTFGFGTSAEPFVEALHAFPARMPTREAHRALVIAFAFAAHASDPRPVGPRRQGALESFRVKLQLAPPLFEALSAAVVV